MEKSYKVPFAYDSDGTMVDYVSAVKGVHYTCECGKKVALRGGDKISPHLYHTEPTECNGESIIHKAYKNAFEKVKSIKLPHQVNNCDKLEFDRIQIEKKYGDIIPDAIGYINEVPYFIEFAHTSYIKEAKLNKIKKANVFCIEISICTWYDRLDQIIEHLKNLTHHKTIVHVPEYQEMIKLREKFTEEYRKLQKINWDLAIENNQLKSQTKEIKDAIKIFEVESLYAQKKCVKELTKITEKYERLSTN